MRFRGVYFTVLGTVLAVSQATHGAAPMPSKKFVHEKHGFLSLAPVGWSTGGEVGGGVTPERRKAVVESIRSFGAKAVFVETSVNPKLIREIARDAGVAIGGELYSDSMGEAGSAGETYIGMMRENTLTIVRALAGGGSSQ